MSPLRTMALAALAALVLPAAAAGPQSPNYRLEHDALTSGIADVASPLYRLESTLGGPVAPGRAASPGFAIHAGFQATLAGVFNPTGPLTPDALAVNFGGQSMRTTSPPQVVVLANTSGLTLTISSVATAAPFAVVHDCASLAPAATCAASVTFTPVAQGLANASLTATTNFGITTVPLSGIGERSLVTHYYRAILRRAPDAGGKAFWDGEAVRVPGLGANVNETWFALANTFFTSAEYSAFARNDAGFVTDLYGTFFNRVADGEGLAFWSAQLSGGMPREVALASFMFSAEFVGFTRAIFGDTAVRPEIDTVVDFYRGLLSRLPDSDGFNFWLARFRAAQCSGAAAVTAQAEAISSAFALSPEYAGRGRSDAQYVGDLYNAFLRRGGDLGGVQFWIGRLQTGAMTREQLRREFVASPEFNARVTALINAGCV